MPHKPDMLERVVRFLFGALFGLAIVLLLSVRGTSVSLAWSTIVIFTMGILASYLGDTFWRFFGRWNY